MNPLNKIMLGIGAALALVIVVAFLWLFFVNAHLKTQLAQAQANDTACHLVNDEFTARVAQQNKAVEQLKAAGDMREKQAKLAEIAATKTARVYALAAEKLRKEKPRGASCPAAENLLNAYLENNK